MILNDVSNFIEDIHNKGTDMIFYLYNGSLNQYYFSIYTDSKLEEYKKTYNFNNFKIRKIEFVVNYKTGKEDVLIIITLPNEKDVIWNT